MHTPTLPNSLRSEYLVCYTFYSTLAKRSQATPSSNLESSSRLCLCWPGA